MTYANTNTVYDFLKRISNKNQQGFFTSVDFNRFSLLAQLEVSRELLNVVKRIRNLKTANYRNMVGVLDEEVAKSMLAPLFVDDENLPYNLSTGEYEKPPYYMDYISATIDGRMADVSTAVEAKLARETRLLGDNATNAIFYFTHTGLKVIQTVQTTPVLIVATVDLTYYKIPRGIDASGVSTIQPPTWASQSQAGGQEIYDPTNSINFELSEAAEPLLAFQIAQYLGINIRDEDVYSFGALGEKAATSETKPTE